jgi:serine/threonine protein kinase
MGEVYRARDTRLGRDVALKMLPESFSRDSDRLKRLEPDVSIGTSTPLFQFHGRSSTDVFSYDVTKDGERFLVNRYVKPDNITLLTILLTSTGPGR